VRTRPALALVIVAALLGGAASLAAARVAGFVHGSRTVVIRDAVAGDAGTAVVAAKPLLGNGFQPAQIYRTRSAGVVTLISYFDAANAPDAQVGQGSGFVVGADGTILTSAHVITTAAQSGNTMAARTVYVEFADGDRVPAKVVGYDAYDDVGVVRVDPDAHALDALPLGRSSRVVVGQPVAAIGSPFGNADSLSVGVVSATGRSIPSLTSRYDIVDAIQTDAPINHGNSGGPLFDAHGRVIGINAQIRSSGTSTGFEGVGFAVPIDSVRRSLDQLLATGTVRYAYVGIKTEDLTPSIARRFGYAARRGALIDSIVSGSGAAAAGLRAGTRTVAFQGLGVRVGGDAIVAIDGVRVADAEDVVRIVASRLLPGESARFTVVHGSARRDVRVTLGERPPG
jgi:S1-C subfamily serine protease